MQSCYLLGVCYFCPEMGFLSLMSPLLRPFGTLLVCFCGSHPCPSKQGLLQAAHANPFPQEAQCSRTLNIVVPGCHLVFGFAPGASATKQLLTFCECQWDLFCLGPLAPAASLADSGAALEPWLMWGGTAGAAVSEQAGFLRGLFCCSGTGILSKSWQGHWLPAF